MKTNSSRWRLFIMGWVMTTDKIASILHPCFHAMLFIFLTTSWTRVSAAVHFVRFHNLDGLVCPSGDIAIARSADSQMICASFCKVYTACKSFFFDKNMGRCYGCNKVYATTKDLLTQESTEYFFDEGQGVALGDRVRGLVFVFMSGQWGTVCNDGWVNHLEGYQLNNLNVVCRGLGLNSGMILGEGVYSLVYPDTVSIWMDEVRCTGSETSLLECPYGGFGNHNCGHDEDVSVSCYDL